MVDQYCPKNYLLIVLQNVKFNNLSNLNVIFTLPPLSHQGIPLVTILGSCLPYNCDLGFIFLR